MPVMDGLTFVKNVRAKGLQTPIVMITSEGRVSGDGAAEIKAALQRFVGAIDQAPPAYSAVKRGGQPLYRLARAGVPVTTEPRRVRVYDISFLSLRDDRLELNVTCSKGTYIRSLAHDLGRVLGCGAHVVELRRTRLGPFGIEQAVTLDRLANGASRLERASRLLPADAALAPLPEIVLSPNAAFYLRQGQVVAAPGRATGLIRVYEEGRVFLGVGEILDDGRLAPRRLLRMAGQ